jgi:hypothetical protein
MGITAPHESGVFLFIQGLFDKHCTVLEETCGVDTVADVARVFLTRAERALCHAFAHAMLSSRLAQQPHAKHVLAGFTPYSDHYLATGRSGRLNAVLCLTTAPRFPVELWCGEMACFG